MNEDEIREYHLPLFVHSITPVDICVINNKLLGFDRTGWYAMYGDRAFELLNELFPHLLEGLVIPDKFHEFLINKNDEQKNTNPCLSGCYADGEVIYFRCLELDLSITKDLNIPIILRNLKFEKKPINSEINLSSEEAFFILSNLCVQGSLHYFADYDSFDKEECLKKLKNMTNPAYRKNIIKFGIEYVSYIRERISNETLEPVEILRTGGIRILAMLRNYLPVSDFIDYVFNRISSHSELSISEKLMFYTLLNSDEFFFPKILEFRDRHKSVFEKIEKELSKAFRPLVF